MNLMKFHPVDESQGYGVARTGTGLFCVCFVEKTVENEEVTYEPVTAVCYSGNRPHVYPSVFIADYAIRKEILPLYKEAHK